MSKELQAKLRKRNIEFKKSTCYLKSIKKIDTDGNQEKMHNAGRITDEDIIKTRPEEKKKVCTFALFYL